MAITGKYWQSFGGEMEDGKRPPGDGFCAALV